MFTCFYSGKNLYIFISVLGELRMYKYVFILVVSVFFNSITLAEDNPTVVFSSAATPTGSQKVFIVNQPENSENPLGNPIVFPNKPVEVFGDAYNKNINQPQEASKESNTNTNLEQNLGSDFENTLLEANDRVYDIQSYPKADFKAMDNPADPKTIYSPNVND